jgi:hypothetical protein
VKQEAEHIIREEKLQERDDMLRSDSLGYSRDAAAVSAEPSDTLFTVSHNKTFSQVLNEDVNNSALEGNTNGL